MPVGANFDPDNDAVWDPLRRMLWEASILMFMQEFPAGWVPMLPLQVIEEAFTRPGWANGDGNDWFAARNALTEFLLAVLMGYTRAWDPDDDLTDRAIAEDCLMMFVSGDGAPAQGMIPIRTDRSHMWVRSCNQYYDVALEELLGNAWSHGGHTSASVDAECCNLLVDCRCQMDHNGAGAEWRYREGPTGGMRPEFLAKRAGHSACVPPIMEPLAGPVLWVYEAGMFSPNQATGLMITTVPDSEYTPEATLAITGLAMSMDRKLSQPDARLAANFTGIGGDIVQPPAFWDQQSLEKWAAVQQLIILITQKHYEALFMSLPSDTLQVLHPGITRRRGVPKTTGPPQIPANYILGGDFIPEGLGPADPVLPILWAHPCVANERFPPTCWEQRFGPVLNPDTAHTEYVPQTVPSMPDKGSKLYGE